MHLNAIKDSIGKELCRLPASLMTVSMPEKAALVTVDWIGIQEAAEELRCSQRGGQDEVEGVEGGIGNM
jgi:hypothetical protein